MFSNETRMLSCPEQFNFRMFRLGLYTPAPSPMRYRVLPRKLDNFR